jgi:chlorite dismutase
MATPESPRRTPRTLSHFALLRFTGAYWQLDATARRQQRRALWEGLTGVADALHLYQVFPLHDSADLLVWTALRSAEPDRVHSFFRDFAGILAPLRPLLEVKQPLWGFTRPSSYTRTRSTQEIDPFTAARKPYLVIYPFVKTSAWYALSRDTRQGMMNGHIRVGKEYPDITQLLLYSTGVQDQEFVVVYETADLTRFSDLVTQLRSTEARAYTERDTPLTTALYHPPGAALELF